MSGGDVTGLLSEAAGPGALLTGVRAAAHAIDGMSPRFVVTPGSVTEVSRVLAVAHAHGLGVVPTGAGARLGWGTPPAHLDVVLSLARLDRVLAYEPADLTLSVEAGATLSALNTMLADHRQFIALDPARPDASTVGGLIATGAAGPYRARYGTMRDLLLGLTVVRADGTVVRGGGRVVKNVSGYDIPKLYVGALGTLGVVVEAHLRLHPRPAEERSWILGFPSAEAALEAAIGLRDTPVVLSRCQLLDAAALRALGEPTPPAAALAVAIGGVPEAVRAQGERVARSGAGAETREIQDAQAWWGRVADLTWPDDPAADLALRLGTRPSDVVKGARAVEAVMPAGGCLAVTTEVATGVVHVTVGGVEVAEMAPLVAGIREGLVTLDGTCVVEHAPLVAKRTLDVWGAAGPALSIMRRLKAELDPGNVLNPGRFVGGI